MKVTDLIEALEAAEKLYRKKHKKPLEIFDLEFDDDGQMTIEGCSEVIYLDDTFGEGSKKGRKPLMNIGVKFYCQDGTIDDRSLEEIIE